MRIELAIHRATLCSAFLLSGVAAGAEFAPNHIFVSCAQGRILEFDPGGGFMRELVVGSADLGGIAFGPDGNLYVAKLAGGKLIRISPEGSITQTSVDLLGYATDLAPNGRNGMLAVCREHSAILNISFDSGAIPYLASTLIPAYGRPTAVEVESNGNWAIAAWASSTTSAGLKRSLPFGSVAIWSASHWNPTGLMVEADQVLVADPGVGLKITKVGIVPSTLSNGPLLSAFDVARGPNGNLLVICAAEDGSDNGALVECKDTGVILRSFTHPLLKKPHRIAIAPMKFDLKLSGRSLSEGMEVEKIAGEFVRLSFAPYSGVAQIEFPSLSFLSPEALDSKRIQLRAKTIAGEDGGILVRGTAQTYEPQPYTVSFALELKGVVDDVGGAVLPNSVKGTLHITSHFENGVMITNAKFKGKRVKE